MCKISVIVPVYKSEKYIARTVNALLSQSLKDMEIILVDDGSPDGSPAICDAFEKEHSNIRCVHTVNGGPGHARNTGISVAKGQYIGFCDADDIPDENMYATLLKNMEENKLDLCLCDMFSERDGKSFGFPWKEDRLFVEEECVDGLMASMLGNASEDDTGIPVWGSSVRSLYSKTILDKYNIIFPEDIYFAEDLVFNVRYIAHCKKAMALNQVMYHYTFNKESLMNSYIAYQPAMFDERIKLINYIAEVVLPIDKSGDLMKRFKTSQRCYFHECVGNAARLVKEKGFLAGMGEIKQVVKDPAVVEAFKNVSVKNRRRKIIYGLIQKKWALVLCIYYSIRFS